MDAPDGSTVCVEAVCGDRALRARLSAMGITPGTLVKVCAGCGKMGNCKITVRDSSVILGGPVAANVMCRCCKKRNNK